MLLADLMEKAEAGQFAILSFLLQKNKASIRETAEATGFSKATLLKYVALFNEKMAQEGLDAAIETAEDELTAELAPNLQGREIRSVFLCSSVKYQILCHLLYKQNFSIQRLAQDLLISEATLSRQLLGLNQILSEFSISIQNGRLKGEEQQIRYFYFLLFRKVWLSERLREEHSKAERRLEKAIVEELCQTELGQGAQLDLTIWGHVTQQRLRANGCQFREIKAQMKPYFDMIFYQRLLAKSQTLFKGRYLSAEAAAAETMLFFAFVVSQQILPVQTMAYILGFGGPIAGLTTQLIQEMKREGLLLDYIDGQVTYELSQLCGQGYIFRGYICQDAYSYDLDQRLPYIFSDHQALPLAERISDQLAIFHRGTDLDRKILWELLQIMDFIAENKSRKITIGLDLLGGSPIFHRISTTLLRFLEYNQFIKIEPVQKGKVFDLIITNNPLRDSSQNRTYYLKNDLDPQDLAHIRRMIYA